MKPSKIIDTFETYQRWPSTILIKTTFRQSSWQLSSFNQIKYELPSSHLSDTWSMLTNPCPIITWDGLVTMVSNFMLIVFNHTTHVRPFSLLYSRSCLYMLSSSSQPRCFTCVNLAYTRCMSTLESITPDHHVVLWSNDLSQWCTVKGNTFLKLLWGIILFTTVILSK